MRWYVAPLSAAAFAEVLSRFRQLSFSEVHPVSGAVRAVDDQGEPIVTDSLQLLGELGEVLGPGGTVTERSFEWWLRAAVPSNVFCQAWQLDERLRCWTFGLEGTNPQEEALIARTTLSVAVSMPAYTRALLVDLNRFHSDAGDEADDVVAAGKAHELARAWDLAFVPDRGWRAQSQFRLCFNNADLSARLSGGAAEPFQRRLP